MKTKRKYRIVIIEPSAIVRKGLENIIVSSGSEFEMAGLFSDISHYSSFSDTMKADVFIVNPGIKDFYRRESVRSTMPYSVNLPVVAILYTHINREYLRQFDGTIDIYENSANIIEKLREMIHQKNSPEFIPESYDLSDREREILISVSSGNTNKEIAVKYGISIHTVMSHRKNIIRKTGIKSVSGLTVYALLNGLIDQ